MVYFPWADIIIKWMKKQGSKFYWIWVTISAIVGATAIGIFRTYGFTEAKPFFAIFIFIFVFGMVLVPIIEYRQKKDK